MSMLCIPVPVSVVCLVFTVPAFFFFATYPKASDVGESNSLVPATVQGFACLWSPVKPFARVVVCGRPRHGTVYCTDLSLLSPAHRTYSTGRVAVQIYFVPHAAVVEREAMLLWWHKGLCIPHPILCPAALPIVLSPTPSRLTAVSRSLTLLWWRRKAARPQAFIPSHLSLSCVRIRVTSTRTVYWTVIHLIKYLRNNSCP